MIKKIGILAISGATAQALNFLLLPIIAYLYGPEEYGVFARFFSYFQIVLPIAGFGLPLAIVLTFDEGERMRVCAASLAAGIFMAVLVLIIITCAFLFVPAAARSYDYLLAVVALFATLQQVGYQWLTHAGKILAMAILPLTNAVLMNSSRIIAGKFLGSTHEVLIIATTVAYGVFAVFTFALARFLNKNALLDFDKFSTLWQTVKKFSHFPKYRTPQVLINTLGRNLPVLFLSYFTTNAVTGNFALAVAALGAGVLLVGNAISGVFYPRISRAVADKSTPNLLLLKTTLFLLLLALSMYAIVVLWGPYLFTTVFGKEWLQAGQFSQWMAPWFIMALAARPTTDAIPAFGLQKRFLSFEITATVLRIVVLTVGTQVFATPTGVVAAFSITNALIYGVLILSVYRYIRT